MECNPRKSSRPLGIAAAVIVLVLTASGKDRILGSNRGAVDDTPVALASPLLPALPGLTGDGVVEQMQFENQLRNARLAQYSAVRTYEVRKTDGSVAAQETVSLEYRAPNQKSFTKQSERGSWVVRDLVFRRLIESEVKTSKGREHRDSSVSPLNYELTLAGVQDVGPYRCYVVEVTPKRKDKYLFVGTIWINTQDFGVVRVAGHPAKKLSFWIERADFVRQYQRLDGFWLPAKDVTLVKVKLYGQRVFTIVHDTNSINGRLLPVEREREGWGDTSLLVALPLARPDR